MEVCDHTFNSQIFYTDNQPPAWVTIDFGHSLINPNCYSMAHRAGAALPSPFCIIARHNCLCPRLCVLSEMTCSCGEYFGVTPRPSPRCTLGVGNGRHGNPLRGTGTHGLDRIDSEACLRRQALDPIGAECCQ